MSLLCLLWMGILRFAREEPAQQLPLAQAPVTLVSIKPAENKQTAIILAYAAGKFQDDNLQFFLEGGGVLDRPWLHYYIVISGKWDRERFQPLLDKANVRQIFERENEGYDFCAWKHALRTVSNSTEQSYAYFILMNTSLRGPFMPVYVGDNVAWPDLFTDPLSEGRAALSGISINCKPRVHVQSMLLAFKAESLPFITGEIGCYENKQAVITRNEVDLTQKILAAGKNLMVMQRFWKGHNFTNTSSTNEKCKKHKMTDPFWKDAYLGMSMHPFEVIFFKTNRGITPNIIARLSDFSLPHREYYMAYLEEKTFESVQQTSLSRKSSQKRS